MPGVARRTKPGPAPRATPWQAIVGDPVKLELPFVVLAFLAQPALADASRPDHQCAAVGKQSLVYVGDSGAGLAECIRRNNLDTIRELRITSGGGSAQGTMKLMRSLIGKLDLVVVDKECASSCANYVLPAAKRIMVLPDSYVLLHGSITEHPTHQVFIGASPDLSPNWKQEALKQGARQLHADVADQATFESMRLSCAEWLHPKEFMVKKLQASNSPLTIDDIDWLLVTPEMAARCLKRTQIDFSWAPPAQDQLPDDIKAKRVLRAD